MTPPPHRPRGTVGRWPSSIRVLAVLAGAVGLGAVAWLLIASIRGATPRIGARPSAAADAATCAGTRLVADARAAQPALPPAEPAGRILAAGNQRRGSATAVLDIDIAGQDVRTVLEGYGIGHLAPARGGSRLAYTVEPEDPLYSGSILTIAGPDGGDPREVYTSERFITGLTWSPDGEVLAFISDGALWGYTPSEGSLSRITDAPSLLPLASLQRAGWSPSGEWIAFQSGGYGIVWLVRPDGSDRHAFADGTDFAWSPDGSELAFTNRGISVAHSDGSGLRHLAATSVDTAVRGLAWSPDGQTIAYSGGPGLDGAQLCVLSLAGDIRQLDGCVATNTRPAWSSDSRWLAYMAQSSPDCEHYPDYHFAIVDATTGEVRRLPGQPSPLPQDDPHWVP